ncbi:hypothetical protein BSFA1_64830 (plasmid) [Burkholderia sp. SFA1]|nr:MULTISPECIES: hypothetical protein [unclassified Caballeronia]MCE4546002.1 hypothetical protein [Caballeronia sp. PC1]MCE4571876.1 hypothetical protein [Caballeronia sp. CLC5]BBQ01355.1 hypothetical protein BSFA1_64830 [Burkholderia sp. SFA1]
MTLRELVEKWLAPYLAAPARVARLARDEAGSHRCVRVEVSRASRNLSMLFFRHDDGSWQVYPPQKARPFINAWGAAAAL